MITLNDIRGIAVTLPEVEEKSHFGRPGFRVRDTLFVSVHLEGSNSNAILCVDRSRAPVLIAEDPDLYQEVWREHGGKRIFVGVRVDLAASSPQRFRELVEQAWRNKAPKRLVARYDSAEESGT